MSNKRVKELCVLFLIFLVAFMPLRIKADEILKVKPLKNTAKAVIVLSGGENKSFILTIEDTLTNYTFYRERIKDGSHFSKIFDLSQLCDGVYTIRLKSDNNSYNKKIEIENSIVSLHNAKKEEYGEPYFKEYDDHIAIIIPEKGKYSSTVCFIEENSVFFIDEIDENENGRRYSLKELPPGEYEVKVSTPNVTKYYKIKKDKQNKD